ncbi:hypothetical protein LTR66_017943 [Elasticomyces elasticus]|nr:hypothetical protein LTR66_017943 [Elasticomyces elasticus]
MAGATAVNPMPVLSEASRPDPKLVAQELPTLSASDFRVYNKLAVMMDAYHNRFRQTWNMLYSVCQEGQRTAGLSIRSFIQTGLQFCHHLHIHHTIEERHIFPELAERMDCFKDDDELIHQHEQIAVGLEKFQAYLQECQSSSREFRLGELKTILDSFGTVLWTHLDQEVKMLGAENMRKYWTKQEIMSMEW